MMRFWLKLMWASLVAQLICLGIESITIKGVIYQLAYQAWYVFMVTWGVAFAIVVYEIIMRFKKR